MPPDQVETLRREIQSMRQESAAAHREIRQEMNAGFARLEKRLDKNHDDHEKRIRLLEIERGRLAGIAATVGAIIGAFTGWFVELIRGGR